MNTRVDIDTRINIHMLYSLLSEGRMLVVHRNKGFGPKFHRFTWVSNLMHIL